MTILQAITQIDSLKHNTYTRADKLSWLSRLDETVKTVLHDTHAGEHPEFSGYDETTPAETELLVEAPFDEMYLRYLEAQIDYHDGEYGRYNNSITMFNSCFADYAAHYTRTHMPLSAGTRFLF